MRKCKTAYVAAALCAAALAIACLVGFGGSAAHAEGEEVSLLSTPLVETEKTCRECGGAIYSATIDPTCLSYGFTALCCPSCGSWERIDVAEALGHSYEERTVEPKCTSYGYTVHTCSRCGDSYRDAIVPNLGHSYEAETKYATCDFDGGVVYTCSRCGDTYTDPATIVSAYGHDFEALLYEPTCTECGYLYEQCSRCGEQNLLETLSPLGHDFAEEHVAGGDGALGYTIYRCSRCLFVEIGEIGAAHRFEASEIVSATCERDGYTVYVCADEDCDETYIGDIVSALGHDFAVKSFSMNRSKFTAEVSCSRCSKVPDGVTISVSCESETVEASGTTIDLSSLSGVCDVSVYVEGERIFYLPDRDLDSLGGDEEDPVSVSVSSEGVLKISYAPDGEDEADTLIVYLVCDGRLSKVQLSGGEADISGYGLSGEVSLYVATGEGALVYSGAFDAGSFSASSEADEGENEEDESPEGGDETLEDGDEEGESGESEKTVYSVSDEDGNVLTVFVDEAAGTLSFSYLSPSGEDLSSALFVYVECGEEFSLVAAPKEIDLKEYGASGDVSVSVFGQDGEKLIEFSLTVSAGGPQDEAGAEAQGGEDLEAGEEEKSGSSGAGTIVAAVVVILLIAALVAYFVVSHMRKKKKGDGSEKKERDVFDDEDETSEDEQGDEDDEDEEEEDEDTDEEEEDAYETDGDEKTPDIKNIEEDE